MSDKIHLLVLTPAGTAVEAEVSEVAVPGIEGELGILPSHTPYLSVLNKGIVSYTHNGRKSMLAVTGGIAEVKEDRLVILSDEVYLPGDINVGELKSREKEIEASLEVATDRGQDIDALLEDLAFIVTLKTVAGKQDTPA